MGNYLLKTVVTGKWVRDSYEWLWSHRDEGGCASVCFESDDKYRYCVCIGWAGGYEKTPANPDGYQIAWEIGRQPLSSVMQCDMGVDFEMPYDPETGDVDDTEEAIETVTRRKGHPVPVGYKSWDALATYMRKTARRVWRDWGGGEVSDDE